MVVAEDIRLADARNEVLRKIGRNLVNFQRMEAMLKLLHAQQIISGAISDLPKIAATAKKVASKLPMGRLAEEFARSAYSSGETGVDHASDVASATFSFRIEADPAFAVERKKALRAVVRERNKLVHQRLASFDPNSLESCETLGIALDEQDERVRPEFEVLSAIVLALRECAHEVVECLDSTAFVDEVKKGIASA
jgi:hypothetical protein